MSMFRDIQIRKNNFYRHKSPAPLRDVDIGKVSVSKVYFWQKKNYKYFIGYLDNNHKVKPCFP